MIESEPLKILIAEDSETDRIILDSIIRAQGYRTVVAKDGKEAIDLFLQESPSIVLMDALMPVIDGFEAAQKIRFLAGDDFVPILFLTSLNDANS
jgi:CheY-like chemotaxis protein